jgi:homocysteine S-methyltransferase
VYNRVAEKLAKGRIIILDGGTGTDIQRRGAPMSGETWCADVNRTHPDIVRLVHEDYIAAGAEVITANTFATSALLFNALGRDDDLIALDQMALTAAKEAARGKPVAVAGSMSTMRPVVAGSDRTSKQREWPEIEARGLFRRKARGLKDAGADLIMMEMMRDTDYSVWATEAAMETGLPVWVGISTERDKAGRLVGFGREDQPLDGTLAALAALKPAVISIMHSSANDTDEALVMARRHWQGPLGAYHESGYFQMPDWNFVDIIAPDDLVAKARGWAKTGATIFGGCCGLGPQHIRALADAFHEGAMA